MAGPLARRIATRVALVVLPLLAVGAVFEGALRVRYEWHLRAARAARPPLAERALIPSQDPALRIEFNPGYSKGGFSVNSFGMADKPVRLEKSEGVTRIAIFGDSISASWGLLARTASFPALIESELNQLAAQRGSSQRFETLNFGVNSYSILESLHMAERQVPRFQPDVVVVQLCLNDPAPSSTGFEPMRVAFRLRIFDFVMRRLAPRHFWARAFVGVHYDEQGWLNWTRGLSGFGATSESRPTLAVLFPYLEPRAYAEWDFESLHQGIALRAKLASLPLLDLRDETRHNGAGAMDRLTEHDPIHPGPAGHLYAAHRIAARLIDMGAIHFP